MPRYVALFRGINVGRAKRIAMADLRKLLEKLGYADVRTLLNSGNAVFTGTAGATAGHAQRIREAVATRLGVDAVVVVKRAADVEAIVKGNALAAAASDPARLLVAVSNDARSLAAIGKVAAEDWGAERVHVGKHAAYVWCADGILESQALPAVMKALGAGGTTRNRATLDKIHQLLRETDGS